MERWWQSLYARFVGFLARQSWRTCVHGKDLVLNLEGPYPMCALCCEQVLKENSNEIVESQAKRLIELRTELQGKKTG